MLSLTWVPRSNSACRGRGPGILQRSRVFTLGAPPTYRRELYPAEISGHRGMPAAAACRSSGSPAASREPRGHLALLDAHVFCPHWEGFGRTRSSQLAHRISTNSRLSGDSEVPFTQKRNTHCGCTRICGQSAPSESKRLSLWLGFRPRLSNHLCSSLSRSPSGSSMSAARIRR